ncbi:MAG: hypothetical protein H8D72_02170 [Planctomycetes bacterium]|nr:hypothetical protein [Planctomycetota bacterium]
MNATTRTARLRRLWSAVRTVSNQVAWFPILVFTVHMLASQVFHAYKAWPPLDIPMHFIGGFAIAYFSWGMLEVFEAERLLGPSTGVLRLLLIFTLTCTAAVFWEFSEFAVDRLFDIGAQRGLFDTLKDMALGITGCGAFLSFVLSRSQVAFAVELEQE